MITESNKLLGCGRAGCILRHFIVLIIFVGVLFAPVSQAGLERIKPYGEPEQRFNIQEQRFNSLTTANPERLVQTIMEMSSAERTYCEVFYRYADGEGAFTYDSAIEQDFIGVPIGAQKREHLAIANGDVECAGKGGAKPPAANYDECTYREYLGHIIFKATNKAGDAIIATCLATDSAP